MKPTEKTTSNVATAEHARANSLLLDIALLSGLAVILAVFKIYDKSNMHMPGVTGIYWVAIMLLGRGHTGRGWAGTFTGGAAGLAAIALAPVAALAATGMTIKFAVTGVVIDLLYPAFSRSAGKALPQALSWVLMGAAANDAKFITHAVFKTLTAQYSNSLMRGFGTSLTYHIIFGAAGGLLAYAIYHYALKRKNSV